MQLKIMEFYLSVQFFHAKYDLTINVQLSLLITSTFKQS